MKGLHPRYGAYFLTLSSYCEFHSSKGHPRSRSTSPSLSSSLPEDEFPPLGPPITSSGNFGVLRGPHSPSGSFSHPSTLQPEEFPPLGARGSGPPVALPGAWTNFPSPRHSSSIPEPDSSPPIPPRRRRPSHPQSPHSRSPSPGRYSSGASGVFWYLSYLFVFIVGKFPLTSLYAYLSD